MSGDRIFVERLLDIPEVQKVTSRINQELVERRAYTPPVCEVLNGTYTTLREDDQYRFPIHQEALKRLPHIIENRVQVVAREDDADETLKTHYEKKRHIGIVFSGGPAPGGHNVIAVLYEGA